MVGIILQEWRCATLEYLKLLPDHVLGVISPKGPVTAGVFFYSLANISGSTFKDKKMGDVYQPGHIACLACVAGETIQDDQIRFLISAAIEKIQEDLFCNREMLILKKQTFCEEIPDKSVLPEAECIGRLIEPCNGPELVTEIEMVTSSI